MTKNDLPCCVEFNLVPGFVQINSDERGLEEIRDLDECRKSGIWCFCTGSTPTIFQTRKDGLLKRKPSKSRVRLIMSVDVPIAGNQSFFRTISLYTLGLKKSEKLEKKLRGMRISLLCNGNEFKDGYLTYDPAMHQFKLNLQDFTV